LYQESGWITCLAQNEFAKGFDSYNSGYINVVDELPMDPITAEKMSTVKASVGIAIPLVIVVFVTVAVAGICYRRAKVRRIVCTADYPS
jgi:hypothetical protein